MMYIATSGELTKTFASAIKQINQVAESINRYVASDEYRHSVKFAISAINSFSQQLSIVRQED